LKKTEKLAALGSKNSFSIGRMSCDDSYGFHFRKVNFRKSKENMKKALLKMQFLLLSRVIINQKYL
jgi:hypothetical protein